MVGEAVGVLDQTDKQNELRRREGERRGVGTTPGEEGEGRCCRDPEQRSLEGAVASCVGEGDEGAGDEKDQAARGRGGEEPDRCSPISPPSRIDSWAPPMAATSQLWTTTTPRRARIRGLLIGRSGSRERTARVIGNRMASVASLLLT